MKMKYVTIIVMIMTMTNANHCKMNARLLMENLASSLSNGEAASSYTVYLEKKKEENLGVRPKLILMVNLFVENGEYAMIIVPLKKQMLVGLYKTILYRVITEKNSSL